MHLAFIWTNMVECFIYIMVTDLWLALEWYTYMLWLAQLHFDVILVCTKTAFSHTRDDISNKQEDRFHHYPPMVGIAKTCPNYIIFACQEIPLFCVVNWLGSCPVNSNFFSLLQ